MSTELRLPNITAANAEGQLRQIQSFLYQHVQQLNWALGYLEGKSESAAEQQAKTGGNGGAAELQTPQSTFNSIKSLIIKSADIVNAYYEEINTRLSGEYLAQSDFGIYSEQTLQDIKGNSTSIQQLFTNIQEISSTVDGLYDSTIRTSAYIKTGLLNYAEDGAPVYGVEIGQTNVVDGTETFDKFARLTSGRLSFYDTNDTEVAYISDYKLYITNAQITGSLTIGNYTLDTSDGLAYTWIGGET